MCDNAALSDGSKLGDALASIEVYSRPWVTSAGTTTNLSCGLCEGVA